MIDPNLHRHMFQPFEVCFDESSGGDGVGGFDSFGRDELTVGVVGGGESNEGGVVPGLRFDEGPGFGCFDEETGVGFAVAV